LAAGRREAGKANLERQRAVWKGEKLVGKGNIEREQKHAWGYLRT
jgi:hypothetical protein